MSDLPRDIERMLLTCFRMPAAQTMMSRKTSITNAFVNSIIPSVRPSASEIAEALEILGMTHETITCAYCGDKCTEWDHLRPLVANRRPTGFISEIGNLVPSCGKCNQSKGNSNWKTWIAGNAKYAPAQRGIPDLTTRIERLSKYEKWRPAAPIDFESILGVEEYAEYWKMLDRVIEYFRECQVYAASLKEKIIEAHHAGQETR